MFSFLLRYIAIAIIGTFAFYCIIPLVRPDIYESDAVPTTMRTSDATEIVYPLHTSSAITDNLTINDDASDDALVSKTTGERDNVRANIKQTVDEIPPQVIVETVYNYTPSTQRIRTSGTDITHWGVTLCDTPFYSSDGKHQEQKLSGGTLIEQIDAKTTPQGEFALCRIWLKDIWRGDYLIRTSNLIRFEGTRERVDADNIDKLRTYYKLNAVYENRAAELKRQAVDANPFAKDLREKAAAYNKNAERAKALTSQRDELKGSKRQELIAELNRLKQSEMRDAAEVNRLKVKYENWKESHSDIVAVNPDLDPVCINAKEQMAALRPELKDFGI